MPPTHTGASDQSLALALRLRNDRPLVDRSNLIPGLLVASLALGSCRSRTTACTIQRGPERFQCIQQNHPEGPPRCNVARKTRGRWDLEKDEREV